MLEGAENFKRIFTDAIDITKPLDQALMVFVERLLRLLYQEADTIKLLRVVISVGGSSDIGRRFFEYIGDGVWTQVVEILEHHIQIGTLRPKDPHYMATNLRGLCDAELLRMLMGAMPSMSDDELALRSQQIVNTFIQAYSTTTK